MRKFTYRVPLCGKYELSSLSPSETVKDFGYGHVGLAVTILKFSGITSIKKLFEPVGSVNSESITPYEKGIASAIRGGCYDGHWEPCSAYITGEGLQIAVVSQRNQEQKMFQLTKDISSATLYLTTHDATDDSLWHVYQYRECRRKRTGEHIVEIIEYNDCVKGYDIFDVFNNRDCATLQNSSYNIIRFVDVGDGKTEMVITDYRP